MSLQDREWYRRELSQRDKDRIGRLRAAQRETRVNNRPAVQLPLPYFNRRQQLWRATRRALRSEWFNVAVFLAVVLAVVIWSAKASL